MAASVIKEKLLYNQSQEDLFITWLYRIQLGIEFYLFVSHGGMKRQRVHVYSVNFVMREALFEIYTWILCRFIPP